MGFEQQTLVKHSASRELSGTQYLVLREMAGYVDQRGIFYGSLGSLADDMRISKRSIQRHVKRLVEAGELAELRGADIPGQARFRGDRQPRVYAITAITGCQIVTPSKTNGVTDCPPRGDRLSRTGCQIVTQSISEPREESLGDAQSAVLEGNWKVLPKRARRAAPRSIAEIVAECTGRGK